MSTPLPAVIPSRRWRNESTGETASIYGASPGPGWTLETTGWTIRWGDGTVGCGRPPFATEAEATAHLDAAIARRAR